MADARTLALHLARLDDWGILFTQWNLLLHDQQIGHTTRALGWLGMISWLTFRLLKRTGYNTLPCPVSRQIRLATDRDKVYRDAHSDSVTEAHWKTTTGRTDST